VAFTMMQIAANKPVNDILPEAKIVAATEN
jgi:hypothetical protein